ncbi:hypothetical protein [Undibacterium sp. Tian12W]|uniref:hypothetical protein n=1 Tax=Undibacterium sp. Tian12W TaxID=3413054 RepID=UPI003BF0DADA
MITTYTGQMGQGMSYQPRRPRCLHIRFQLACASGILVYGADPDFLVCVAAAKEAKRAWLKLLPCSTLRVQFFYPNRKRVPAQDIKAALRALNDKKISAAVAVRSTSSPTKAPARSGARTAAFAGSGSGFCAVGVDVDFCQAGVVAPPDGLTGETFPVSGSTDFKGLE